MNMHYLPLAKKLFHCFIGKTTLSFLLFNLCVSCYGYGQEAYGTSIAAGNFGDCPTSLIQANCPSPNTNYIPSTVRLGIMGGGITGNTIDFTFVQQCPPGSLYDFPNGATAWLKEDGVCGPVVGGPYNLPSGAYGFSNMTYIANFTSSQKDIYLVVEIPNGNRYYGGPVTVYAPPPVPEISVVNSDEDVFEVDWNNVSGEDGYDVFRADCSSCSFSYQNTLPPNVSSYIDDNVVCGNDYCYKVTAFSNDGVAGTISDYSNIECDQSIRPYNLIPGAANAPGPQLTTLTPTLDWANVPGATSYGIAVWEYPGGQNVIADNTGNTSSYNIQVGELQNGQTYRWKATSNCGGVPIASSNKYFQTPPSAPPIIEFSTCISVAPSVIQTGSSVNITTGITNTGGSIWTGDLRVEIEEVGNPSNNMIATTENGLSLSPSAEYSINTNNVITLAEGEYRVYAYYKETGSSIWEAVKKGDCSPHENDTHYEELSIQPDVPGSLEFDECITASLQIEQGATISGQIILKNPGTQTWTGNLDVLVKRVNGGYTTNKSLYHVENQNVSGGNNLSISFSDDGAANDTIMGALGSYYIYVAYTNAPNGCCGAGLDYAAFGNCPDNHFTFVETQTISHKHPFTLVPPGTVGGCDITTPDPNNPAEEEAHTAATFLCNLGIIVDPSDGNVNPYGLITRGELAKILYFGLLGYDTAPTVASSFPTPFLDLIDPNAFYYDAAKALSYLQYDDKKTAFDREFVNFNPLFHVKRGHLLKALLETFDVSPLSGNEIVAGVDPSHEMYGYVNRACELGLITCDNPAYQFLPDNDAQRYEAFILLWRYLDQCPNCDEPPTVQSDDFFYPTNVTPENMGKGMGFADANFKHYTRTSFSIPGKKIPLVFEHVYNSYAVDLPDQIYEDYGRPMGIGWSHSYHCYIQKFEHHLADSSKLVVFWPGNSLNVYYENGLEAITKNLYDDITDNGNTITIKRKNQVVYTFERLSANSDVWILESIEDRNNNKVQLFYQNYNGAKKRLFKVRGTAGRELKFFYENVEEPSFITKVEDPLRFVQFTYEDEDLKTYRDPGAKTTTYNYGETEDDEHLILSIQLPKGNTITNTYNDRKLNSTSTNNQMVTGNWTWGPDGATNQVNMPVTNGDLDLNYTQNRQGNTTSLQVQNGSNNLHTMAIQYNDPDNPYLPTYVNVNDDIINYSYDDMGNVEQIALPLGITHQFAYTNLNDVDYYIDPKGAITDFAYDGVGNLKAITDPLSHITNINYFADGLVKKVTNPENIEVNYSYDNYGNLEAINAPEGIQVAMSYDVLGRMKTYTDPNGQITRTFYHPDDLVDKVINTAGNISDYTYDNNNNLTEIENVNGESTILTYDFDQDWLMSQGFGGNTDQFTYYPDGRLHTHTDPNDHTDTYSYDAQGRLSDDGYATYDYYPSPDNQLESVTNVSGEVIFTYDVLNRVKTVEDIYNNVITYDYDSNSNIETIHYPDGKEVDYTYDAANRLIEVTDWNNNTTTYTYFDDGRLKRTDLSNNTFAKYYYDDAGRMTGLGNFKTNTDTINFYSYVLDPSGNHLQVTQKEPFAYHNWNSGDTIATYDDFNHIETFGDLSYGDDENGNITSVNGTADYDFEWDTEDQMIRLDSANTIWAEYTYDGLGHRRQAVREGTTTRYVLDILGMSKVLMETDENNAPTHYYIHGLGQIARVDASGNYHYYHYDYRGSTIAMTNDNKTITHQYQYGPYGETLQATEADFNAYRYVGAQGVQYEKEDIYFMRARYYDVKGKRFISEDPIWGENLYAAAKSNPIIEVDPTGSFPQVPYAQNMSYDYSYYDTESSSKKKEKSFVQLAEEKARFGTKVTGVVTTLGDVAAAVSENEALGTALGIVGTTAQVIDLGLDSYDAIEKDDWERVGFLSEQFVGEAILTVALKATPIYVSMPIKSIAKNVNVIRHYGVEGLEEHGDWVWKSSQRIGDSIDRAIYGLFGMEPK